VTRLLLIRHGETEWNLDSRYQGHSDIPLNTTGRRQAAALARRLAGEPLAAIYSSDLCRARATAEAVAAPHGLPVHTDARLREIGFGQWEGLTRAEIEKRYAEALALWYRDPANVRPPDGETVTEVAARLRAAVRDIAARHDGATVALVGHGGAFQVCLCVLLGVEPARRWQFKLGHGSLSVVELHNDAAILMSLNDCHHLDE